MDNLVALVEAVLSTTAGRWQTLTETVPQDLLVRAPAPSQLPGVRADGDHGGGLPECQGSEPGAPRHLVPVNVLNEGDPGQAPQRCGGWRKHDVAAEKEVRTGLPSLEEKHAIGRVKEEQWNVPITMYGCNKLYCEHLGRYFTFHSRQLGALATVARLDFRAIRFPGLISAETVPTGGTSDFGPEMLHAAAQGKPYKCFVEPEARIPFMAMPDAVRALLEVARADRDRLSTSVYNIGGFSVSAKQIAERVQRAFPEASIDYEPDPVRAKIVASWPQDVDDARAATDWAWKAAYDFDRAFDEYLLPNIHARYARA